MEVNRAGYALANELENMMNSTNLTMSPRRCIFKVPNTLLRQNPKAYLPNAFSIGPYHYGEEQLEATQKIKLKYLHDLISRFADPEAALRTLTGTIRGVEQEARDCYADPIDHISADEFVKILVLDGCFLIELFRKDAEKNLQKNDDPVFTSSCMRQFLSHDLILLENQIPWLVLKRLFDIVKNTDKNPQCFPLSMLALSFSHRLLPNRALIEPFLEGQRESKHVLDLLRNAMVKNSKILEESSKGMTLGAKLKETGKKIKKYCLKQCLPKSALPSEGKTKEGVKKKEESKEWKHMPSARRLTGAGVNLKKGNSSTPILDIKFKNGALVIPEIVINHTTESLLRNLICLEQCLPNCRPIVTCFAKLLDDLINTDKDVKILCESEILVSWLNIDDAVKSFNQLCNETYITEHLYSGAIKNAYKFCKRRRRTHPAVLLLMVALNITKKAIFFGCCA